MFTFMSLVRGGSRIFFRRGCTRLLLYFNTNKPHSFFVCRISVVLENRRSSRGGGGGLLPEHAPVSFCTCNYTRGSVFKFAQFAPGVCSQIFNRLHILKHFAKLKLCPRGWSIPMKSLVHTEEPCSRSVPLEPAPGGKSLVCIRLLIHFFLTGGHDNRTYARQIYWCPDFNGKYSFLFRR